MEGHTARERQSENPPVHIPAAKNSLRNKQLPTAVQSIRRRRGRGLGDPFINQTAGAEPRRAPLNRKPPGVFERNILQLRVSTSAVYLRATVDESAEESERVASVFSSTPTGTALTLGVTFRASAIARFSEPGPLRFPRSGDCLHTGNMCVWGRTEGKRRRVGGGGGGCFSAA